MMILKGMYLTAKALMLNQTKVIPGTAHQFTRYPEQGHHVLEILPDTKENRPFQNLRDGIRGDKRGWYTAKKGKSKWHKFWWNAIRNPLNTHKRLYKAIDIARCKTWVKPGYLEHVDEDSASTWGEKWVIAEDLETGEIYESYESMLPLLEIQIGNWKWSSGYCIRRMEGYKFDFGEELIPFPDRDTPMTYEFYRDQCFEYARVGWHNPDSEAMINLDRLAPLTGRKGKQKWWAFTLKKINNS